MKLPSALSSFIYKCDFFSTKVGFRFNEERQYASLTGGIISIMMIFLFIGIFTNTGISTMNKEYIISSQNKKIYEDPSYLSFSKKENFYFMVGLAGIDMNNGIRYFDITMAYTTYNTTQNSTKKIKNKAILSACKKQVWSLFEEESVLQSVSSLDIGKWLCPPQNDTFELKGKFTSQQFKFIKIGVQKCNPATDTTRRCATNAQLIEYLQKNEIFTLNFYFINTILNPEQKDHIKYYLQDKNYFPFTLTQGLNANLYVSEYNVKTDESLLPVEQIEQRKGGIVKENAQFYPYYITGSEYIKFYLRKSNEQLLYLRSFRKIDDTLSYIGGLFSSLLSLLFLVCFYNELSYELQIAKNIYRYDKDTLLDTNGFHFLSYIVYLFYFILKIFGFNPQWQKMEQYDRSLSEVRKQMDVRLIFKKILFTEKLASALLTPEQLTALHLQDKITISTAEEIRQNYFLPKLLVQEIQEKKMNLKNPIFNRLPMQKDEEDQTSKAFSREIQRFEKSQDSQDRSKSSFIMNEELYNQEGKNDDSDYRKNNDKITNSLSMISLHEKSRNFYFKLIEIISRLEADKAKGDQISRKILKGISPQIKELLDIESSSKITRNLCKQSILDTPMSDLGHYEVPQPSSEPRWKKNDPDKVIEAYSDSYSNFNKKPTLRASLGKLRLRRSVKSFPIKQIKDIIVIEDYRNT